MKTAKRIGEVVASPKTEWDGKPMATKRPGIDIRPGALYIDHEGRLVRVEAVRPVDHKILGITEVVYIDVATDTRHRVMTGFARLRWTAATEIQAAEDRRVGWIAGNRVLVLGIMAVFAVAALIVLAVRW